MNFFDLLIILVLSIAFYSGYKNGLIKTIFRTAGYIAGGAAGLALAVKYLRFRHPLIETYRRLRSDLLVL